MGTKIDEPKLNLLDKKVKIKKGFRNKDYEDKIAIVTAVVDGQMLKFMIATTNIFICMLFVESKAEMVILVNRVGQLNITKKQKNLK